MTSKPFFGPNFASFGNQNAGAPSGPTYTLVTGALAVTAANANTDVQCGFGDGHAVTFDGAFGAVAPTALDNYKIAGVYVDAETSPRQMSIVIYTASESANVPYFDAIEYDDGAGHIYTFDSGKGQGTLQTSPAGSPESYNVIWRFGENFIGFGAGNWTVTLS